MAKAMNDKTRDALNSRITTEISKLRKEIHGSVEDLRLSTKEARMAMKREILGAVRDAAKNTKENLATAVKNANVQFVALNKKFESGEKESSDARAALTKKIADEKDLAERQIADAVKAQNKALLALKTLTAKKIEKTNQDGAAVKKNAKAVGDQMSANMAALTGKLVEAEENAKKQLGKAKKASVARHVAALESIK